MVTVQVQEKWKVGQILKFWPTLKMSCKYTITFCKLQWAEVARGQICPHNFVKDLIWVESSGILTLKSDTPGRHSLTLRNDLPTGKTAWSLKSIVTVKLGHHLPFASCRVLIFSRTAQFPCQPWGTLFGSLCSAVRTPTLSNCICYL